ncbi:MAG: 3-isopropylmalate dehydratase large subunit [Gammaproteobacteria bacterium]|nr:MAG: 3-isopropylmalate dehydratase large subunit [Gammaproteobacteria bacterium]
MPVPELLPESLFDKLWNAHVVEPQSEATPAILYIDLHLVHEVTSPQGFDLLREKGIGVRRPERTLATLDHATPSLPPGADGQRPYITEQAHYQVQTLRANCREFGIELHDWDSPSRGIVHVMGPELGATQPGMTIVCGDSHTSTHGAFGALAFGIGTTEVGHVLAKQCLLQNKPGSMRINVAGTLGEGVTAKDLALNIIRHLGMNGGTGYVIEYAGEAVRSLDMESRMTLCNLTIEAGARAGLIAPDETTIDYLRGRAKVPQGEIYARAAEQWLQLASDKDAAFDQEITLDASGMRPTITYGTDPGMSVAIGEPVPAASNASQEKALQYMGFRAGQSMRERKVDIVFVGSCTNGRISDLRAAASVLRGRRLANHVRMLVVPGSENIRRQAEIEGLHEVFSTAGAEWRLPGCSMCIAMNGDTVPPGKTAVSTSNRNFAGRQGAGSRTLLASPETAAACAVMGHVAKVMDLGTANLETVQEVA